MTITRRLLADQRAATAVEFGIVAPVLLVMLLGVFQIGIWMQSYNAMRSAIAETARNVSVEYQTDNLLTDDQIEDFGLGVATTLPYMLEADKTLVEVNPGGAPAQTIAGTRKLNLTITHQMPSFLEFAGITGPQLTYSRAVFVEAI
ncbi:TadE/TadG family type IV pilus assembly protein [Tsuneonella sp. HG249]